MSTTTEGTPTEGNDFWATFAGLGAGIVGVAVGKQTRAKLQRKRLDKQTGFSSPSSVVTVEDMVITVEVGTGSIPPLLGSNGPLVVYGKNLLKMTAYADAYLYEIGQEKYEQGQITTVDLTFAINSEPVVAAYTPGAWPPSPVGFTTTTGS